MTDILNNMGIMAAISAVGIIIGVFLFGFNTAEKYYSVPIPPSYCRKDLVKRRLMILIVTEVKCPVCDSCEIFVDDPYLNYSGERGLLLDLRCKKCDSRWDVILENAQIKKTYDGRTEKICDCI